MTVTAGLSLLVYALVEAVNVGWGSAATLGKIAGALVLLAIFVAIERRSRSPLMPFSIFRIRTLRGADIVALLIGMSLFSMFFFVSLYMQQVLGFSALKAGLSYLPLAVGIILAAGAASVLVTRFGFKPVLLARPAVRRGRAAVVLAGQSRTARSSRTCSGPRCSPRSVSGCRSCR